MSAAFHPPLDDEVSAETSLLLAVVSAVEYIEALERRVAELEAERWT